MQLAEEQRETEQRGRPPLLTGLRHISITPASHTAALHPLSQGAPSHTVGPGTGRVGWGNGTRQTQTSPLLETGAPEHRECSADRWHFTEVWSVRHQAQIKRPRQRGESGVRPSAPELLSVGFKRTTLPPEDLEGTMTWGVRDRQEGQGWTPATWTKIGRAHV